MKEIKYSFEQACNDANVTRWLDDWDYDKNGIAPSDVSAQSNKRYWFKCHRNLHESTSAILCNITKYLYKSDDYALCKQCNSIGQYIIDTEGLEYLNLVWSNKNVESPFEIAKGSSRKRIWLKCLNNDTHPDYDLIVGNYTKSHSCPYCSGRRVCESNSLGYIYPQSFLVWSNLNNDTPNDYTHGSGQEVWWKCENGLHNDYKRQICDTVISKFRCPICGRENQKIIRGEEHHFWKGGITPQDKIDRKCWLYNEWRKEVYKRDNYTCQVCLDKTHNRLRAHHIISFAKYPDLRFNVQNGITCCEQCHDTAYKESFHNIYGTHNNTPEQFQTYVIDRRKQLGIEIPFNIYDYMSSIEDDNLEIDDTQLDLYE